MREQPPKNGVARRLWDLSDEEVDAIFEDDDRERERQTTIDTFGGSAE
jgi:hypothetical protein